MNLLSSAMLIWQRMIIQSSRTYSAMDLLWQFLELLLSNKQEEEKSNNTTPEAVYGDNVIKLISGVTWLGHRASLSGCFLVKWLPLSAKHRKCSNLSQASKCIVFSGEMNIPNYVAEIIMHAATDLDSLGPLRETNKVGSLAKLQ